MLGSKSRTTTRQTKEITIEIYVCLLFVLFQCGFCSPAWRFWWLAAKGLFYPGLNFTFFSFKLIIIHYHTQKQRKIKFKPRIKYWTTINIYMHCCKIKCKIWKILDIFTNKKIFLKWREDHPSPQSCKLCSCEIKKACKHSGLPEFEPCWPLQYQCAAL